MRKQDGFALITVMLMSAMLAALLWAHFVLTRVEMGTTRSAMDGTRGFYAAEAGLSLRAGQIRQTFLGYNRPVGSAPADAAGALPCSGADPGAGDYRCTTYGFEGREVVTFVTEDAANPRSIVVPLGEPFENLSAQAYRYRVHSVAVDPDSRPEAILDMEFESRLIPLFQFAAFYNKDLEILPGPPMSLSGPVHTNGDLYLDAITSINVHSQVTAFGTLFRGRKSRDECLPGDVQVDDPASPLSLPACGSSRIEIPSADLGAWHGAIRTGVENLTVPPPDSIDPLPGKIYWDRADIRIMLDLTGGGHAIAVRRPDGSVDGLATPALTACGAVTWSESFFNNREGKTIRMLEVDTQALMDCLKLNSTLIDGKLLDDRTDGGLVWYLGVTGDQVDGINDYGVRVSNGSRLGSGGAPAIQGLTVVTNQAIYVQGDYNSVHKKPAAFLADSLNILSNGWDDADAALSLEDPKRRAKRTTIHAAFLAGTDITGDLEGTTGQNREDYNGGLENFPRFHEDWTDRILTYRGSFVSLNAPLHVEGAWDTPNTYFPPNRDWSFDADFNDAANLPPLSPRFVKLKQNLFMRQFEL